MARTVTFQSVLWGVAKMDGIIPEEDDLDRSVAAQITEGINGAYRYAWQYYDWIECKAMPELSPVEHPDRPGSQFIAYALPDGGFMERVFEVWRDDPFKTVRPRAVHYRLGADGIYFPGGCPDVVWVEHAPPPPQFSSARYAASTAYAAGSVVYFPDDGECYVASQAAAAGTSPPAAPWRKIDLFYVLAQAVKVGAHAFYVGADGQKGASALMEQAMIALLDHEIDVIDGQMGATKTARRRGA